MSGSEFRKGRNPQEIADDAQKGAPDEYRRNPRGRIGAGYPKSPRPGVRDPGKPYEGSEGEKAYGPPIDDKPENRGKKKK
jgi:hypothetical protein